VRVQAETEVKESVRKGAAKSLCRARECSAQCLLDGASLFPSHVTVYATEKIIVLLLVTVSLLIAETIQTTKYQVAHSFIQGIVRFV